jgi:hypothetical protein
MVSEYTEENANGFGEGAMGGVMVNACSFSNKGLLNQPTSSAK